MNPYRLRTDLPRAVLDGFALPLGLEPLDIARPHEGYTLDYVMAERDGEEECYRCHIVVSHERVAGMFRRLLGLLGPEVDAIVEIGSRDAYRSTDVFLSSEPLTIDRFREVWSVYESFLLEDGIIAAGATSEDPVVEVLLDEWKGILVMVPIAMRAQLEEVLRREGLQERDELWPTYADSEMDRRVRVRPVLEVSSPYDPDVDELLYQLRQEWDLELDVDPLRNVDESGRELPCVLWHAILVLEGADDPESGTYATVWASAPSLAELEQLVDAAMAEHPEWRWVDFYSVDRVAYDERPPELAELHPRRERGELHLLSFDRWDGTDDRYEERNARE